MKAEPAAGDLVHGGVIGEREGRLSIRNGTSLYEIRMASTRIVITQDQSRPLNPNPSPNVKPKFA